MPKGVPTLRLFGQHEWMDHAACAGTTVDFFAKATNKRGEPTQAAERAKAICAACAVETECLTYALDAQEREGIWGGTTPEERRSLG